MSRRGYDKREVRDYLEDLEQAFRELEGHSKRSSQRVADLERDLSKARATEKVSVDNAMMAVFDAKDRILDRARRKAAEIEEEAHAEASRIKSAAISDTSGGDAHAELMSARAQAEEVVAAAQREAERIRVDAAAAVNEDLEAELAATSEQLRRAHADTAAAREELDAARKRIVELEGGAGGSQPSDLERRCAELETHRAAARSDAERLEAELAERDAQILTLQEAVTAADRALSESKSYVAGVEADLGLSNARVAELGSEIVVLRSDLDTALIRAEDFPSRMRREEERLVAAAESEDQGALVAELMKVNSVGGGDETKLEDLERHLAEAERTISELREQSAQAPEGEEVDSILAAAREEAEAIKADAEGEAERRSAKVIARAREEAEQVRRTVATLTEQAEDARSAAVRSKMEAEDLAETQRSIIHARDDIVATAQSRADELEKEAQRAAATKLEQAETMLAETEEKARQIEQESVRRAAEIVAAAEERAAEVVETAEQDFIPDRSELAAMMAEAERELETSVEIRQHRAELDLREQELAKREEMLKARELEVAELLASRNAVPLSDQVQEPTVDETEDDDEDLADRVSALLEQASVPLAGIAESTRSIDLSVFDAESAEPPLTRMAWPTPGRSDTEAGTGLDGVGDDDTNGAEDANAESSSRYDSRSAQLPRLGEQAKSNLGAMADLREKSRGKK